MRFRRLGFEYQRLPIAPYRFVEAAQPTQFIAEVDLCAGVDRQQLGGPLHGLKSALALPSQRNAQNLPDYPPRRMLIQQVAGFIFQFDETACVHQCRKLFEAGGRYRSLRRDYTEQGMGVGKPGPRHAE